MATADFGTDSDNAQDGDIMMIVLRINASVDDDDGDACSDGIVPLTMRITMSVVVFIAMVTRLDK